VCARSATTVTLPTLSLRGHYMDAACMRWWNWSVSGSTQGGTHKGPNKSGVPYTAAIDSGKQGLIDPSNGHPRMVWQSKHNTSPRVSKRMGDFFDAPSSLLLLHSSSSSSFSSSLSSSFFFSSSCFRHQGQCTYRVLRNGPTPTAAFVPRSGSASPGTSRF